MPNSVGGLEQVVVWRKPISIWLCFAGAAVALFALRFTIATFSEFSSWDDEGYILLTLRDYLSGLPIYSGFYTQYGPVAYQFSSIVYRVLNIQPVNDSVRILSVFYYTLTLIIFIAILRRLIRSYPVILLFTFAVGQHLMAGLFEPGHPQEFGILLIAASVFASIRWIESREKKYLLALSVTLAALSLVKLNLALFFAMALFITFFPRKKNYPPYLLIAVLVPVLLMQPRFEEEWVRVLAAITALQIALLLGLSNEEKIYFNVKDLLYIAVGGITFLVLDLFWEAARGASLNTLLSGLVLQHLAFGHRATQPVYLSEWAYLNIIASLFTFLILGSFKDRFKPKLIAEIKGLLRFLISSGILAFAFGIGAEFSLYLGLPWAWILVGKSIDCDSPENQDRTQTIFLAFLSVFLAMQSFPVGGAQVYLGTIPLVLLSATAFSESFFFLMRPGAGKLIGLIVAVAFFYQGKNLSELIDRYLKLPSLNLPGATLLHLEERQVTLLQQLVLALKHCDTFVTDPGFNSLYIWTNKPPPTHWNVGAWRSLLSAAQQESIVHALNDRAVVCAVRRPSYIHFWGEKQPAEIPPLVKYIDERCTMSSTLEQFELGDCSNP